MFFLVSLIEIIFFGLIYHSQRFRRENPSFASTTLITKNLIEEEDVSNFFQSSRKHSLSIEPYDPSFSESQLSESVIIKLWQKYLDKNQSLFDYINERVNLTKFSEKATLIINSATYYNIEYIEPSSQQLFVNLHVLNDLRRVNLYLIKVNENLVDGGVFVCCGETTSQRYSRFHKAYGTFLGGIFYFFDFLYRRVSPKIPIIQGMYFALTKGRNRTLSKTEILGRLYFCGFELLGEKEMDAKTYFIVKKIKEPSKDESPSYGPLIKLKRVGLRGELFNCYKLRTMHPYSEYLQEYIHNKYSVSASGKFANDFRITSWGLVLRKFWIDELPQLYNLVKGDLRLIGARAVSPHYLSKYPKDVIELRLANKPGLIPVYTADKTTSLAELIHSERAYLQKRAAKPFTTDIKYLSKAVFNIITGRAKSLDNYK
jgi:lipopolysaccharide/colanic/teichoic acid biosynthesis glycosyltransferase